MLDRQNPKPLHVQLEIIIKSKVDNMEWMPNTLIPSENELSKLYGVSRMTARASITRLVTQGMLYRVMGKGTFVAPAKIMSTPLFQMGIREQLERMGYETKTKLISIEKSAAPAKIERELQLSKEIPIYIIRRVRFINDMPLSLHTSYVPAALCPDLELNNFAEHQLCDILEKDYNLPTTKMVETLESITANFEEAELLSIKPGYPLLLLENIAYTNNDLPYEFSKVLFRGDKIKLKLEHYKK